MVPAGARYAHKTGEPRGVENVAGLVLPPGRVLVPAVLAQGDLGLVSAPVSSATGIMLSRWAAL